MAGPVEKIYVEIGAPIQKLDRDMAANERRVEQGATRMANSVRRAERGAMGAAAGVGAGAASMNRFALGGSRFALGALGLGISGAYIGRNIEGITIKINSAVHSVVGILNDLANGVTDAGSLLKRNAGGFKRFWENLADEAYAALTGQVGPSAGQAERDRFRDIARMGEDADFELRKAQAKDDAERRRIETEQKVKQLQRDRDDKIAAMPEDSARITAAFAKLIEAALLEGAPKAIAQPVSKARFDTINTVFGAMKLPSRMNTDKAAQDTAKNTKDTATATRKIAAMIERNAVAIVGFA